jgi:hypothetical protein
MFFKTGLKGHSAGTEKLFIRVLDPDFILFAAVRRSRLFMTKKSQKEKSKKIYIFFERPS